MIDTKWEQISSRIDDPKRGVTQADIYQMMAYGQPYGCKHLTLLYPHHPSAGYDEGVINRYTVNASQNRLELFSLDIARSDGILGRLASACRTRHHEDDFAE